MGTFWDSWCGKTMVADHVVSPRIIERLFNISLPANDDCVVNLVSAVPHLAFLLASSSILLYYYCCRVYTGTEYTRKLPSHYSRWLLLATFLVVCGFSIGEGILTDFTYQAISTTQPHLYVPQCFALLAVISSLIYFQHCEVWQSPRLAWIPLTYWVLAFLFEAGRLITFLDVVSKEERSLFSIFRFDIILISTVVYLMMIVLESTVVCAQVPLYHAPEEADMHYYEDYSNPLSLIMLSWLSWVLKEGYRNPLEMKHLGSLPQRHTTRDIYDKFKKNFTIETTAAAKAGRSLSLWRVISNTYRYQMFMIFIQQCVTALSFILQPIAIFGIITYVELMEEGLLPKKYPHYLTFNDFFSDLYVLAVFYVLQYILQLCMYPYTIYQSFVIGVHLRTAVQTHVYEKSLRLSNLAGSSCTVGEITNHMSVDATNLLLFAQKMPAFCLVPINLVIVFGYLWHFVGGMSVLLCIVAIVLFLPLLAMNVKLASKHQTKALKYSDIRLKRASDMLNGIKLLKLYGWEDIYLNLMNADRSEELKSYFHFNLQFGLRVALSLGLPIVLLLVTLRYPYLQKTALTPSVTFTVIILVSLLFNQIWEMCMALSTLVSAAVSAKRLTKFFQMPEIEDCSRITSNGQHGQGHMASNGQGHGMMSDESPNSDDDAMSKSQKQQQHKLFSWLRGWRRVASDESPEKLLLTMTTFGTYTNGGNHIHDVTVKNTADDAIIRISGGSFAWVRDSNAPILNDINVTIHEGKLVMVVGAVGCGKSSLLSAILGEMRTLKGSVKFNERDSVAYAAQTAGIINATLRENILFGKPYDHYKYQYVIESCALRPDLDILPAGDMTEIGEKGINLSGGQRQRVSVARAMYSDKEIVLMDDPLSALDVHVGDHVFNKCIKAMLSKENRTVILVTHQLQHLQDADLILVMKDGEVIDQGSYDIVSKHSDLLGTLNTSRKGDKSDTDDAVSQRDADDDDARGAIRQRVRSKSVSSQVSWIDSEPGDCLITTTGQLVEKEEMKRGSVSYKVYWYLCKSMGLPILLVYLLLALCKDLANTANQFWLGDWAEAGLNTTSHVDVDNEFYILWYSVISIVTIGLLGLTALAIVAAFYLASKRMYTDMVHNIFSSPIRFFETTPAGRILNRFSFDVLTIDAQLLQRVYVFMASLISGITSILAIAIVLPTFLVEISPVVVIFCYLQNYYLSSSRELQRLESVTRSPVYAHFSETLGGLPTIRAYGERNRFFNALLEKIDVNNTAFLFLQASASWIMVRVYMLGSIVVLLTSLTAVITVDMKGLTSSYVGIALSYGTTIVSVMKGLLKSSADVEIQMNAVERVQHYTQLETEDYSGILEPASDWPSCGGIEIDDISVRYADDLPPVLKGVSLYIRPGDKVGICGRTGSGKSSLTLTLFRLINTFRGRIVIDGEDIAMLPLKTVRQRLSIIPQDPILFTGTIRHNLDPERKKTDSELWDALETAQLKAMVSKLRNGLDYEVEEGGENFSVGQRQLFCVARAFLRNSKILVMDEATASVDYETEKVLQKITDSAFRDKTVITIAHRISTILNSDTIVVLSDGEVIEHDTPEALLSRDSVFASLVKGNK